METRNEEYLIGIDEAGLGPVFGPMVVSAIIVKSDDVSGLERCGVKDSKLFGSSKRARKERRMMWEKTKPLIGTPQYKIISAEQLESSNMYDLEIGAVAEILTSVDWRIAETVYIAQLGQMSRKRYLQKLQGKGNLFSSKEFFQKVIYEKDADSRYIPVSMASIVAKVVRDDEVEKLCKKIGEDYISGYPNEETAAFLRRYFEKHGTLPPGVRRTHKWPPLQELLSKENIRTI